MTKIPLNPQNKQNTIETSENDQNTPKLSQNTLDFIDFGGILDGLKLFCSIQRILGNFAHFSNIEVYFIIILNFLGILIIHKISKFDCSFQLFHMYFGHFRDFQILLVVLEILRHFWSINRFQEVFFGTFCCFECILVILRVQWPFQCFQGYFFVKKNFILPVRITKILKNL